MRCTSCGEMLYRKAVAENKNVCTSCGFHFRVPARQRVQQVCDADTFEERHADLTSTDPLTFTDRKAYADRLKAETLKSGERDALICGRGFVKGRPIMLAVMDPSFMMGSMGSVVGEKITRTIEEATAEGLPLLIVSCSGGARMQESTLSLMQLAKTSAALARHD